MSRSILLLALLLGSTCLALDNQPDAGLDLPIDKPVSPRAPARRPADASRQGKRSKASSQIQ